MATKGNGMSEQDRMIDALDVLLEEMRILQGAHNRLINVICRIIAQPKTNEHRILAALQSLKVDDTIVNRWIDYLAHINQNLTASHADDTPPA